MTTALDVRLLAAGASLRALAALPRSLLLLAGSRLGDLAYLAWGTMRRRVLANLRLAFGTEKSAAELAGIARASYRHFGQAVVEVMASMYARPVSVDRVVRVEGLEEARAAFRQGKGVILVGAHIGNWELCARTFNRLPRPVNAIVRNPRSEWATRLVARMRQFAGMETITTSDNPYRAAIGRLEAGEAVGFLIDVNAGKQGIFVEFMGRFASTARGPVSMALRTGAPIVFALARRCPDGTHVLTYSPALPLLRTGDKERDLLANTAALTRVIEREIRSRPEQYYWFHRRWKQRPPWEANETR